LEKIEKIIQVTKSTIIKNQNEGRKVGIENTESSIQKLVKT